MDRLGSLIWRRKIIDCLDFFYKLRVEEWLGKTLLPGRTSPLSRVKNWKRLKIIPSHPKKSVISFKWTNKKNKIKIWEREMKWPTKWLWPLYKWKKKIVLIMGFMVFKSTGSDSRFQSKNRFWKIWTGSRDIVQNVPKYEGLV